MYTQLLDEIVIEVHQGYYLNFGNTVRHSYRAVSLFNFTHKSGCCLITITKRKIIINHHLGCFDDDEVDDDDDDDDDNDDGIDDDDSIITMPDSLKLPSLGCFGDLRDTEDDLSPEKERSFTIVFFYFIFLFIKI